MIDYKEKRKLRSLREREKGRELNTKRGAMVEMSRFVNAIFIHEINVNII